jgi:uncharacterized protein YjhX (UPF0386 family)
VNETRSIINIELSKNHKKKRLFGEIEGDEWIQQINIDRHQFLQSAKDIIFQNFPGISLEEEKFLGRKPNEKISIKAKKDSIGRTCPISLRQHSANSIYFILNPNVQSVDVKCFSCEGYIALTSKSKIFDNIKSKITISEKNAKHYKTSKYQTLENLDSIEIVQFQHLPLNVDHSFILEFYDLYLFVQVPAKTDRKQPSMSNWNMRTFDMNEKINFHFNNIAIVCGEVSGIFVVDVDVKDDGLLYFQQLCTKHNYKYDNETTCVLTPSGGIHLYYIYSDLFPSNSVRMRTIDSHGNSKPIGIDIRSNGGCVIAPPSVYTIDGNKVNYRFLSMKKPKECPQFLLDAFTH